MSAAKSSAWPVSPVWLVVAGVFSVQLGAGVAKSLFDRVDPTGLVWLRLAASAVIMLLIARPVLRGRGRGDWVVVLGYGASLGLMNWSIYQSFQRIPLGLAVTIEFAGPLLLAVLGSRRPRDLLWVLLAGVGVALLGFERTDLDPVGVLYAVLAGGGWAAYIVLSARTGRRWPGLEGLSVASVVAMLLLTPAALGWHGGDLLDTRIVLLGALVGLLSSVIPYTCELIALRSISPALLGILMSLEPAAAALAGIVVLAEFISPLQWAAIACVIAASVGATRSGRAAVAPA